MWLPAINEALRKIVQDLLAGETDFATARLNLRNAIVAAGYHPGTSFVEAYSPADLLWEERLNLILRTNLDMNRGFGQYQEGQDPAVLNRWPAQELFRAEDRKVPRDWLTRWKKACEAAGDGDALLVMEQSGRLIALKTSKVWELLGSRDLFKDGLGNPWPPFAFNSAMWVRDIDREQTAQLGVVTTANRTAKRDIGVLRRVPVFMPIEDERMTEFLWNEPQPCDHCGEEKPIRLIHPCDNCGENICPECRARGCSVPDLPVQPATPWEPSNATECFRIADGLRSLCKFPLGRQTAEQILQWCDRAFQFGFPTDFRSVQAHTHKMRGEALESLGFKDRALQEYELAIEKDPQVGVKKRIALLRQSCAK